MFCVWSISLPLCGAAVTFFAAAKKVTKESSYGAQGVLRWPYLARLEWNSPSVSPSWWNASWRFLGCHLATRVVLARHHSSVLHCVPDARHNGRRSEAKPSCMAKPPLKNTIDRGARVCPWTTLRPSAQREAGTKRSRTNYNECAWGQPRTRQRPFLTEADTERLIHSRRVMCGNPRMLRADRLLSLVTFFAAAQQRSSAAAQQQRK